MKTLLLHVTAVNNVITDTMLSHVACYIQNMCVYIHVEIELMVFHMLFPIIRLLRQVSALLTKACEQISLQAPAKWMPVAFMCICYIARCLKDLCKHAI